MQDGADEVRKHWIADEVQTNGFWTFKDRTGNTRQRLADAEVNPVSSYSQALKFMDEKDRRSNTK